MPVYQNFRNYVTVDGKIISPNPTGRRLSDSDRQRYLRARNSNGRMLSNPVNTALTTIRYFPAAFNRDIDYSDWEPLSIARRILVENSGKFTGSTRENWKVAFAIARNRVSEEPERGGERRVVPVL